MLVSDQVFRALLEAVIDGRYAPGEKLPTQRALTARPSRSGNPFGAGVDQAEAQRVDQVELWELVGRRGGQPGRVGLEKTADTGVGRPLTLTNTCSQT
jgi:hypothetical protein